jgi:hypothetical protein
MIGRCQMIGSMAAKPDAARFRSSQGGLRAIRNHLAFMLGNGGEDSGLLPQCF